MINEMIKTCNRICASPTSSCKFYYECCMVMSFAIKIGIDTPPTYWKKNDVKQISENDEFIEWYGKQEII